MNSESGRNRQQPEYLNEKDASEDRQGIDPENADQGNSPEQQNNKDRQIDIAVRNALHH
jgi:hypothetical protein